MLNYCMTTVARVCFYGLVATFDKTNCSLQLWLHDEDRSSRAEIPVELQGKMKELLQ